MKNTRYNTVLKESNCNPENQPTLSNTTTSDLYYFIKVPATIAEQLIELYTVAQWADKAREILADHVKEVSASD